MESKLDYLKAVNLHYKLSREQRNLVLEAMDGYGNYREKLGESKSATITKTGNSLPICKNCDGYYGININHKCFKCLQPLL